MNIVKKSMIDMSIIISTYNRSENIKQTISSILNQKVNPLEIIIIDDSTNNLIKQYINKLKKKIENRNIILKYFKKPLKDRGLTKSRNLGIKKSSGNILLFLDDDIILFPNYLEEIMHIYSQKENINGVQGIIINNTVSENSNIIIQQIRKCFYLTHWQSQSMKVLPSFEGTYPINIRGQIETQWFTGCNQSYKRKIFQNEIFDEKLIGYGYKEDLDFSYRISKKFGNLIITSKAKLIHRGTFVKKEFTYNDILLETINSHYLFYKNIPKIRRNLIIFYWSIIGKIFLSSLSLISLNKTTIKRNFIKFINKLKSEYICFKRRKKLENGLLDYK